MHLVGGLWQEAHSRIPRKRRFVHAIEGFHALVASSGCLALCLRCTSNSSLKDPCRNDGLVVFGGFTLHVRPHCLTQPVDEFSRSVASVAKHVREPINAE